MDGTGYAQTLEQIRAMPELDVSIVMAYYESVRKRTVEFFADEMEEGDLGRVLESPGTESFTCAAVLGHLLAELAEHLGQIDYIRGMMRGINK